MFTVTDFLNILKYVQDQDATVTSTLDKNLKTLSVSEQAKVQQFFEATIDQNSFNTNDYKRLKNFFVDWYTTHRTIVTTQKNALDPHSLPDEHLNELIKAFGFDIPSSFKVLPYSNKPSFFLDLVNLYKIKGTPQALIKLLGYFGISNVDLIEYWLRKDPQGNIVFRGEEILSLNTKNISLSYKDLEFDALTNSDPHWFLTEAQVNTMFENNKIRFPSKTPYFGLRPTLKINELESIISIISKQCQNEYDLFTLNQTIDDSLKTIKLTGLNLKVSLLELYTAAVYSFDKSCVRGIPEAERAQIVLSTLTEYKTIMDNYPIFSDTTSDNYIELLDSNFKNLIDTYLTPISNSTSLDRLVQDIFLLLSFVGIGETIGFPLTWMIKSESGKPINLTFTSVTNSFAISGVFNVSIGGVDGGNNVGWSFNGEQGSVAYDTLSKLDDLFTVVICTMFGGSEEVSEEKMIEELTILLQYIVNMLQSIYNIWKETGYDESRYEIGPISFSLLEAYSTVIYIFNIIYRQAEYNTSEKGLATLAILTKYKNIFDSVTIVDDEEAADLSNLINPFVKSVVDEYFSIYPEIKILDKLAYDLSLIQYLANLAISLIGAIIEDGGPPGYGNLLPSSTGPVISSPLFYDLILMLKEIVDPTTFEGYIDPIAEIAQDQYDNWLLGEELDKIIDLTPSLSLSILEVCVIATYAINKIYNTSINISDILHYNPEPKAIQNQNQHDTKWKQTIGTFIPTIILSETENIFSLEMTSDLTSLIGSKIEMMYKINEEYFYGICSLITSDLLTITGNFLPGDVTELYFDTLSSYKTIIGSKKILPVDYFTSRITGDLRRLKRQNQLNECYGETGEIGQFAIPEPQYFLSDSTSGILLNLLNPELKNLIDSYYLLSTEEEIIGLLLRDLGTWVGEQFGLDYTNISNEVLGLKNLDFLIEIINFFKPYRARLTLIENIFLIDNPLADSHLVEDELYALKEVNMFADYDTADSKPGFELGWLPSGEYVTSTPPLVMAPDSTGTIEYTLDSTSGVLISQIPSHVDPLHPNTRVLSMYVDSTGVVKVEYDDVDATSVLTTFIYSNPQANVGAHRITNIYLTINQDLSRKLVVDYDDEPETVGGVSTKITSLPTSYDTSTSYVITDVYLNNIGLFTMVYDADPYSWQENSINRVYYSRNTMDNGSYFDIGASSDNPPYEPDTTLIIDGDDFIEKYNYHDDSTSHVYITDITRNSGSGYVLDDSGILTPEHLVSCYQYGGFTNMDEGGVFDAPFASEVCHITVVEI